MIYLGLDLAATTGIAIINTTTNNVKCFELKPRLRTDDYAQKAIDLFCQIQTYIPDNRNKVIIGIEKFVYFAKSRVTQANLANFFGYVYFTLLKEEYKVIPVHIGTARKQLGVKSKLEAQEFLSNKYNVKLTNNESDALSIALFLMEGK